MAKDPGMVSVVFVLVLVEWNMRGEVKAMKTAYVFTWKGQFHEHFICTKKFAAEYARKHNLKFERLGK